MVEGDYAVVQKGTKQAPLVDWYQVTLSEVLSFSNGASSPNRTDNLPHPVYGSNGIIGFADETNASSNVVVIGRVGSYCGSLHFSDRPCWITDNAIRASAVDENDAKFLYYLLHTLNLNEWRTGSGQPLLNQSILSSIPTCVPPLPEQRAIAHILGTLDDKIELNRRMNQTLEEMARALFKSWFVDFEPVRAKMEGRWRRGHSLPGMPAELYDLFPDWMTDSELGKIPGGWEVKALDEIADFRNGLALQRFRPKDNEDRLPVVKIAQLRSGRADSGEWARVSIDPSCILEDGDIVFSWSGSLLVTIWCGGPAALNQHLFKVTSTQYPKWFYMHCTLSHLDEFRSIAADKATTMGHIKRHHLADAKCVVPAQTLLSEVDAIFAEMLSRRTLMDIESRRLSDLRDALLPKLVSGEVRVGLPEIPSEENG